MTTQADLIRAGYGELYFVGHYDNFKDALRGSVATFKRKHKSPPNIAMMNSKTFPEVKAGGKTYDGVALFFDDVLRAGDLWVSIKEEKDD